MSGNSKVVDITDEDLILGHPEAEVRLFVGPGAQHYLAAFKAIEASKLDEPPSPKTKPCLPKFNVPALIAGVALSPPCYLFYRKMYWYGLGVLVLQLGILGFTLAYPSDSMRGVLLLSWLVFAFCSDRIYASFVLAKLNQIAQLTKQGKERLERIKRSGGVDWLTPAVYLAGLAGFAYWLAVSKQDLLLRALSKSYE